MRLIVPPNTARLVLIPIFVVATAWLALPPIIAGLPFGWDAVVYTEAARTWLVGGNPWIAQGYAIGYAAPPTSFLPFVPFVWLPAPIVSIAWVAIAASSAVYVLRRCGLPAWWLLFPPVSLAIMAGSSALPVTALLVRGGVIADAAAVWTRIYAAVPLLVLGRWRSLLIAGASLALTLPMWLAYLDNRELVAATFADQSSGGLSALALPWLVPIAVLALMVLGRQRAAWLLVPVLWPDTQLYYAVIALPILGSMPIVALSMALPVPGLVVAGIAAQAALERFGPISLSSVRRSRAASRS